MRKYSIDLGDSETIDIPKEIQKKIIHDHLIKYYHWTIGISCLLIGFLGGIIAAQR